MSMKFPAVTKVAILDRMRAWNGREPGMEMGCENMEIKDKTISASATTLSQLILPSQTNPAGNAHGGELLKMMDNCAGVCATKHSRSVVVTAGIDNVNFHAPVFMGNQVTCKAHLTYVSNRSMEIAVSIDAEDILEGTKQCCMTAYFIFVAVDENMQPKQLDQVILENEIERQGFEDGRARMDVRKENPKLCWLSLY